MLTSVSRAAAIVTIAVVTACTTSEPTASPSSPAIQASHDPDTDGLPDLIVDQKTLATSWVIYDESFSPDACDVIEGDVTGGDHRTLRLTVNTPNIGDADVAVGDPNKHIDPNGDEDFSDSDGLFELATCHQHYHFRHYATYELIPILEGGTEGEPIIAAKRGFCMIDVAPFNNGSAPKAWVYRSCGRVGVPGNQGIATGWADQYYKWLAGQFFVIDPDVVAPGAYLIRIHVNPPFTAAPGEPCPALDGSVCHQFAESDYSNNVGEVRITIPSGRPGKTGYGPGGGQELPSNKDKLIDDENRPAK